MLQKQSLLALILVLSAHSYAAEPDAHVGAAVCGQCHRAIAVSQAKTNMARTWLPTSTTLLPQKYNEERIEGSSPGIAYRATRQQFEATLPGQPALNAPVEEMIGGSRHGISFLVRLHGINGTELERQPLVETRYLHSANQGGLVLSPGFPTDKPASYETALGRALSPSFEKKCLDCHGQPSASNSTGGVHCESCHGPGKAHLEAVAAGTPRSGIINPAKMTAEQSMEPCAHCHNGFTAVYDPLPDDLLISNQVNALKNSECYVQSGAAIRCTNCHDPHDDGAAKLASKSAATCLQCHSAGIARHAALCPVNRASGCVGCHMPEVTKGSFTMADHWIRVHPEQHTPVPAEHKAEWKSQVTPKRVFLRLIATNDAAKAAEAREMMGKGASFFDVARQYSSDPTAPGGGYLGAMKIESMEPGLAKVAAALAPGEISPVFDRGGTNLIVQRLPRDFRWHAEQIEAAASALKAKGMLKEAADKYQEALRIDPYFLRALVLLGSTLGEQGDAQRAAGILEFATRLYPEDAAAQYNLGIAYGALGRSADEIRTYRRALDLEPDLVAAYQNLGAALYAQGQPENAIDVYRQGLRVNPLSAVLYYNIGVVRREQGDAVNAQAAIEVARKIDPEFVSRQEGAR